MSTNRTKPQTVRVVLQAGTFLAALLLMPVVHAESELPDWLEGPDWAHKATEIHETEPLGKRAEFVRPLLMAHYEPVDYLICGQVLGPLFSSKKEVHEIVAWQIIFASGDWVLQNPDQSKDIHAYTLAGLESGLRTYKLIREKKPRKVRTKMLEKLLERDENGTLEQWVRENPCKEA